MILWAGCVQSFTALPATPDLIRRQRSAVQIAIERRGDPNGVTCDGYICVTGLRASMERGLISVLWQGAVVAGDDDRFDYIASFETLELGQTVSRGGTQLTLTWRFALRNRHGEQIVDASGMESLPSSVNSDLQPELIRQMENAALAHIDAAISRSEIGSCRSDCVGVATARTGSP
jgi:hypothetical protein